MRCHRWTLILLVLITALAGCIQGEPDDEPAVESPRDDTSDTMSACTPPEVEATGPSGGQSGVSNQPGAFSYGGQAAAKTAKEVFLWENPSAGAMVAFGGQSGLGTLRITIQDHCGVEVYTKETSGASQSSSASESTKTGTPGTWILTFEFTVYTGQMGVSITSG